MPTVTEILDRAYRRVRCGVGGTVDRADEPDPKDDPPADVTDAYDRQLRTGKYFRVGLKRGR